MLGWGVMRNSVRRTFRPELVGLEGRSLLSTLTVTSLADSGAGSLRQEVQIANLLPGADVIKFAPALSGGVIHLTSGEIVVNTDIKFDNSALGAQKLTVDAGSLSRIFDVQGSSVQVIGLTLAHGADLSPVGVATSGGGAIVNYGGNLVLKNDVFFGNSALYHGGAVFNYYGNLQGSGDYFVANTAGYNGGAVYNSGQMSLSGEIFANNTSKGGGAVENSRVVFDSVPVSASIVGSAFVSNHGSQYGGGVANEAGATLVLNGDQFVSNTSATGGGAFFQDDFQGASSTTISNSVFLANSSVQYGGALANIGSSPLLTVQNSQFVANVSGIGGAIYAKTGSLTNLANTFVLNTPDDVVLY